MNNIFAKGFDMTHGDAIGGPKPMNCQVIPYEVLSGEGSNRASNLENYEID